MLWQPTCKIAYHANGNLILQQVFQTKSNWRYIAAYSTIMTQLAKCGLVVDLQILENEASAEYNATIIDNLHRACNTNIQRPLPGYTCGGWSSLSTVLMGSTITASRTHPQPSQASQTQPLDICLGVFQWTSWLQQNTIRASRMLSLDPR